MSPPPPLVALLRIGRRRRRRRRRRRKGDPKLNSSFPPREVAEKDTLPGLGVFEVVAKGIINLGK